MHRERLRVRLRKSSDLFLRIKTWEFCFPDNRIKIRCLLRVSLSISAKEFAGRFFVRQTRPFSRRKWTPAAKVMKILAWQSNGTRLFFRFVRQKGCFCLTNPMVFRCITLIVNILRCHVRFRRGNGHRPVVSVPFRAEENAGGTAPATPLDNSAFYENGKRI